MDAQSSQNARQVAGCKVLGASKAASALVTCVRCHQTGPFNVTNAFPSCCLARLLLLQLASWPWQSRVIQKLLWSLVFGTTAKNPRSLGSLRRSLLFGGMCLREETSRGSLEACA